MRDKITHERLLELLDYDRETGVFRRRLRDHHKRETVSVERVKDVLDYDPLSGQFVWKIKTAKKIVVGTIAGVERATAGGTYRLIAIDGERYAAQRLAWLWCHGHWPVQLTFKDGNTLNSAIDNLEDIGARVVSNKGGKYLYTRVDGVDYLAARLAWFHANGEWPKGMLRFRDGNIENLALANLRDVATEPGLWSTDQGRYESRKAQYEARRDYSRDLAFKAKFGISLERYNAMLAEQDSACAVCGQPESATRNGKPRWLAVDHNHTTNAVRGLLCHACNILIGYAREDAHILRAAIDYLEKHNGA